MRFYICYKTLSGRKSPRFCWTVLVRGQWRRPHVTTGFRQISVWFSYIRTYLELGGWDVATAVGVVRPPDLHTHKTRRWRRLWCEMSNWLKLKVKNICPAGDTRIALGWPSPVLARWALTLMNSTLLSSGVSRRNRSRKFSSCGSNMVASWTNGGHSHQVKMKMLWHHIVVKLVGVGIDLCKLLTNTKKSQQKPFTEKLMIPPASADDHHLRSRVLTSTFL